MVRNGGLGGGGLTFCFARLMATFTSMLFKYSNTPDTMGLALEHKELGGSTPSLVSQVINRQSIGNPHEGTNRQGNISALSGPI